MAVLQMQMFFRVTDIEVSPPEPIDHRKVQRITILTEDGVFQITAHLSEQKSDISSP